MCEQPGTPCPLHNEVSTGHPVPDPLSSHDIECPCDVCTRHRAAGTHPSHAAAAAARRRVYAEDARRTAAVALDRYLRVLYGTPNWQRTGKEQLAAEAFVECMGDYVESRLHHSGHYGVSLVGPLCAHGFVADGQACGEFGCTEPPEECGAHGAHPHNGRKCLDCPVCMPPDERPVHRFDADRKGVSETEVPRG